MKLHVFIPDLTSGGAEKVFATLLRLWDCTRDDVTLVVLRREGPYFDLLPPDLRIVSLEKSRLVTAVPSLVSLWRRERPDVVLATQAHVNGLLGWMRLLVPGTRFVGRETSLPSRARVQKKLPRWEEAVYRAGYRRLDAVICPSNVVAEELAADYRIPPERLPVIPNPVDLETVRDAGAQPLPTKWEQWFAEPGAFVLAASGRLEPVKGFDLLLEALARLPERFRLVVLGEGRLREELTAQSERLGLSHRVAWTGFEANPHRFLTRSHAFVLSSRYEGFPNAVLEALGLGLPVAAFRCPGGVSEILSEGETGSWAEPESPASLAEAIGRVAGRRWDAGALRALMDERYRGPVIVRRYADLLEEVLHG